MKPVVSALNAWSCVVISLFAIVILSVLGSLYSVRLSDPLGHEPDQSPALTSIRNMTSSANKYSLLQSNNHAYTGSEGEPKDGPAVAASIYTAVIVYTGFFVFCGFQAYLHMRNSRGGAISLH
ncbi:hypothetical protein N7508_001919 [Penicillium antarcticum]|uniref:uncharacterized protein n=1 Tax=Penicillium antarcticum TaxID=416450 RepID=UPI0023956137|nr:uncharacterized protein N7508_001919 [Penicillium antarcticum]KAJ5317411.1 hypothetical protein N7508_001919 [Penicillium antarcticum]